MANILTINPAKCVACKTCEIVCSLVKSDECNPKNARIRVVEFEDEGLFSPMICFQCKEAWCALACPAFAIERSEETGALVVNEDRCVGCRMCTMACPFGQIFISQVTGKARKCDLCSGDPMCVKHCPTQTLKFEKIDTSLEQRRRKMAKHFMVTPESDDEIKL